MGTQRSVQQQNAVAKAQIQRLAARFANEPGSFAWLYAMLRSREFEPKSGMLVQLAETPEQEGNLVSGIWLTKSLQFWEFAAVVFTH
jgi:hypothetical protein